MIPSARIGRFARATSLLVLAALLLPALAMGAGTPSPREDPPVTEATDMETRPAMSPEEKAKADRQRAEELYAKGYEEAEEAKKLEATGKEKDAKKKFAKARKRFESASRLDENYYEAWNMLGYCARKAGDLKRAFDAYRRCLAINPDYEEAHEYLGEAYLMSGDIAKAKEQLAWLRARESEEAEELAKEIEAAEQAAAQQR